MDFKLEKDNKFLIIMLYYNRPEIVKDALLSIKNQKYKNWVLAFIDDCSDIPGVNIVKSVFDENDLKKIEFYNTYETKDFKVQRKNKYKDIYNLNSTNNGSFTIPYFNKAMDDFDFDIALFLCDDDLLYENYLNKLNDFYNHNSEVVYSYSNIILFDRNIHKFPQDSKSTNHRFFRIGKQNGYYNLDTSQVSWRSKIFKEDNVKFDENYHVCFDAEWYKKLYLKYGLCEPNFLISQYKSYDINIFNL